MYYVVDTEVFACNWLVIAKDIISGERTIIHNDNQSFKDFHKPENIYIGFNIKHYDQYILKAILSGADNALVKNLNDFIINGNQGFEHWLIRQSYIPMNVVDVRDDMQLGHSLKSIEGHFGEAIRESEIPFTITRALTEKELEETISYCSWDVDMTENIFRRRKDYFSTKVDLAKEAGIDPLDGIAMTNAKLTAKYLHAEPFPTADERDYVFPEIIDQEKLRTQVEFFKQVWDKSITDDEIFKMKMKITLGGMEVVYGFGGVHGGLKNYQENSNENRVIVNYDVASLYPSLMIRFGYFSRAMRDPERFIEAYHARLKAKAEGNKVLSNALKLLLNTTYGAMLNQYNALYDPLQGRSVCITGQLLLTDLFLDYLSIPTVKPINFNTDGVMMSVDREFLEHVRAVSRNWEEKTTFVLEEEIISRIIQKDVNNYWCKFENGKTKVKGGYLTYGIPQAGAWNINNSNIAVKKAIAEHFDTGRPVADLILMNPNIFDFQIIAKAGSKYKEAYHIIDGNPVGVQKVNRVYATRDERYGKLVKVKAVDDSESMIESLPEHCFIDNNNEITLDFVDKMWYIRLAEQRVQEYLKGKKRRKKNDK